MTAQTFSQLVTVYLVDVSAWICTTSRLKSKVLLHFCNCGIEICLLLNLFMLSLAAVISKGLGFTSSSSVSLHPSVFLHLTSCHTSCLCPPPLLRPRSRHPGNPPLSRNNTLVILPSLFTNVPVNMQKRPRVHAADVRAGVSTHPDAQMISAASFGHEGKRIYKCFITIKHAETLLRFFTAMKTRSVAHCCR